MKKTLIGSAAAVLTAAAVIGTPFYLGAKAKQSLETQHKILAETFFFDVVSHQYQSGWLESTETTVLRFHPNVLANMGAHIPDNVRAVLEKPITMVNRVRHQPFANGIRPVRAVVDTQFKYDPEAKKTLARFFGDQEPLTLHNVIRLDGSGELSASVAPFDYEELSGIKLDWKGLSGIINYQAGFNAYQTKISIPSFNATLADKGSLNMSGLDISADSHTASDGKTALGSSRTTLSRFNVEWKSGMDYSIRLNDLINMVTDLQIGAFINPRGTIAPNRISVENLRYTTETAEPEPGYLNTSGAFAFDKLHYGDTVYGPLEADVAANHLNAGSLNALKARWQQIAAEKQTDAESRQNQLLAAVRSEGAPLFTDNPVFELRKFSFTTPTGHINTKGRLQFDGLLAADLNNISPMLAKMKAELDLDVSQNLIEDFAVTQARGLFATENPDSPQEQQEVSDTIRLLMQQSLQNMAQDGYITQENGAVKTRLAVSANTVSLNGKRFKAKADEDLFADLEDNAAPAAASAP